jgi:hypothetical protein
MASPLTVLGSANSGRVMSQNNTYATARSSGTKTSDSVLNIGQLYIDPTYYLEESFLEFDTSAIGAGQLVSAVVLSLYNRQTNNVTTAFTMQAKAQDYGVALTTADWMAGDTFAALTTLATCAVPTGIGDARYYDFTSVSAFLTAINCTGVTRLVICSDAFAAGTAPTGYERQRYRISTDANQEPKLVVTYAPPGCPKMTDHFARLRR